MGSTGCHGDLEGVLSQTGEAGRLRGSEERESCTNIQEMTSEVGASRGAEAGVGGWDIW